MHCLNVLHFRLPSTAAPVARPRVHTVRAPSERAGYKPCSARGAGEESFPQAPRSGPAWSSCLRASVNSDSPAHLRRARHFPSSLFAGAVTVTQISPIGLPAPEVPRTLHGMGKLLSSLAFYHPSCLGFHRQERDAAEEPDV